VSPKPSVLPDYVSGIQRAAAAVLPESVLASGEKTSSDPLLPVAEAPLGIAEPPEVQTIEYDEEALRHFEDNW
jgi:hypothetical protein